MGALGPAFRILTRNLGDLATLSATGGTVFSTSLPLTNVQKQTERSRTARATSIGLLAMRGQMASQQRGNMLALTRTNASTAATLAVQLWSDAFVTSTYTGAAAPSYPSVGLNSDIDVASEADFANLRNGVYYFPQRSDILGWQLALSDSAPVTTFMDATRLWFGTYYEVQYSPMFGAVDMTFDDASVSGRSDDGTHLVEKKYKKRTLKINLDLIIDQDLPTLLGAARYLGKDKECFISLYPQWGGAKELYHQGAFRLTDSPTFNPYQIGLHKNTMTFEET